MGPCAQLQTVRTVQQQSFYLHMTDMRCQYRGATPSLPENAGLMSSQLQERTARYACCDRHRSNTAPAQNHNRASKHQAAMEDLQAVKKFEPEDSSSTVSQLTCLGLLGSKRPRSRWPSALVRPAIKYRFVKLVVCMVFDLFSLTNTRAGRGSIRVVCLARCQLHTLSRGTRYQPVRRRD